MLSSSAPAWSFPVSLICRVLLWRREFTRDTAFCFLLECYKGAFILKGYPVVSLNLIRPWMHDSRHSWSNWQRYLPLPVSNLRSPSWLDWGWPIAWKPVLTISVCVFANGGRQPENLKGFFYSPPTKRGVLDFFSFLWDREQGLFRALRLLKFSEVRIHPQGFILYAQKLFKDMIFLLNLTSEFVGVYIFILQFLAHSGWSCKQKKIWT